MKIRRAACAGSRLRSSQGTSIARAGSNAAPTRHAPSRPTTPRPCGRDRRICCHSSRSGSPPRVAPAGRYPQRAAPRAQRRRELPRPEGDRAEGGAAAPGPLSVPRRRGVHAAGAELRADPAVDAGDGGGREGQHGRRAAAAAPSRPKRSPVARSSRAAHACPRAARPATSSRARPPHSRRAPRGGRRTSRGPRPC